MDNNWTFLRSRSQNQRALGRTGRAPRAALVSLTSQEQQLRQGHSQTNERQKSVASIPSPPLYHLIVYLEQLTIY